MFDATQTSDPASSTEAATTRNARVLYLKVVEGDTYTDWETSYLDTEIPALEDGSDQGEEEVGRKTAPMLSELRFLQTMSVRATALSAGTSEGSGKVLQYRALFLAANLAQGMK